ncbi:PAS domain S-box protein [Tumebacillus sp. ITR2]|uniref:histidine kinase n=1 Tax=Tumebacillus amylolyticus TaxID=2801339 RepID=A0ABS1J6R8_9BACL|nr:ATP-binding protein [Tumebacillus amylolyticus]MBL0385968.1 PAS domain S-box protein [Tumebacillus amylolyticus]
MAILTFGFYWLNTAVWWGVMWLFMQKRKHSTSSSIRAIEGVFSGVALALALAYLMLALHRSALLGVIPSALAHISDIPVVPFVIHLLLLAAGGAALLVLNYRFDHLDREVATVSLHSRYRYMIMADKRAILVFSTDGSLQEINPRGCEWMRDSEHQLIGRPVLQVLERLEPEDAHEMFEQIIKGQVVELKRDDRILGDFEWTELLDEDGHPAGQMLCFSDVTENKKFQREIIQSEKLAVVGQLAAATAHEIRNPLTSIKGFLQLFEHKFKGDQGDTEIREYTRIMVEEVDRMEKIIRDFLLMTKPSDVTRERADVNGVIERLLVLVQNQATLRNINVVTDLGELTPVLMHKEAIQQVLLNLMQNAFEAMNIGGTLTIHTEEDEKYVSSTIQDTGVGMTEEEVANLGSPFYSTKTEGTGLGLTVSSKIIHEHGGILDIRSEKGVGTTITVKLPK